MSDTEERSASGAPIYRHGDREAPFEPVAGDGEAIKRIDAHLERFLGKEQLVWHELVSDLVHIDVHQFAPRAGRECTVLVTSGMSDRAMAAPEDHPEWRHAEVLICLPPSWSLDEESLKDERHYWPIRLLKGIARFPHEYATWLGWGHTVPNGDPPEPFAPGVPFSSVLLEFPLSFPKEFFSLRVNPEKEIRFFSLIPLHDDELRLKMTKGVEALEDLFDAKGITDVLDPKRPSVARRKWLGVF